MGGMCVLRQRILSKNYWQIRQLKTQWRRRKCHLFWCSMSGSTSVLLQKRKSSVQNKILAIWNRNFTCRLARKETSYEKSVKKRTAIGRLGGEQADINSRMYTKPGGKS